jgi:hypothetical protein
MRKAEKDTQFNYGPSILYRVFVFWPVYLFILLGLSCVYCVLRALTY